VEGQRGDRAEPSHPGGFVSWGKTFYDLPLERAFIEFLLLGPEEGVLWYPGHETSLLESVLPNRVSVPPNRKEYTKARETFPPFRPINTCCLFWLLVISVQK
jgi:hypothetical protein